MLTQALNITTGILDQCNVQTGRGITTPLQDIMERESVMDIQMLIVMPVRSVMSVIFMLPEALLELLERMELTAQQLQEPMLIQLQEPMLIQLQEQMAQQLQELLVNQVVVVV